MVKLTNPQLGEAILDEVYVTVKESDESFKLKFHPNLASVPLKLLTSRKNYGFIYHDEETYSNLIFSIYGLPCDDLNVSILWHFEILRKFVENEMARLRSNYPKERFLVRGKLPNPIICFLIPTYSEGRHEWSGQHRIRKFLRCGS